ncbi:FAD binding domain-containing protein [Parvularcula oceani]|uniref:FAD binding domain-containing protein n=1 Tax=Parvularcula oceani TaxID=1247963 RepID=UPI0004E0E9CD|nr:xanthine dehydrogenase family protein subunit M [Parvularcula oceani]
MRPFAYARPKNVRDATDIVTPMGVAGQGGAWLAGGTTLIDLMKLDVLRPEQLTDIQALGMDEIETDGETVRLGARVTMAQAAEHPAFKEGAPVLSQALWKAASPQLRNVATLGGNLLQRTRCPYFRDVSKACNKREPGSGCDAVGGYNRLLAVLGTSENCIANYPGDWANAAILFDAVVETRRGRRGRAIELGKLHRLPGDAPARETVLEDDELITAIELTVPSWARRSYYLKVRDRESYAFANTGAAVALDMDGDSVREARIGLSGVATTPWRAREAEAFLRGKALSEETAMQAGAIAFEGARGWGHNDFKIPLGQRTVARALLETARLS